MRFHSVTAWAGQPPEVWLLAALAIALIALGIVRGRARRGYRPPGDRRRR